MKKIIYGMSLPIALTSTLFAGSGLFDSDDAADAPPPRRVYLDYAIDKEDSDYAYSIGAIVHAKKINHDHSVGHTGYNATNTSSIVKGSTIEHNDDWVAAVETITKMSNRQSGMVLTFGFEYHNKPASDTTVNKPADSSIYLYNPITEADSSTEYQSVTHSNSNKDIHFRIGLEGYSLQYKASSFTPFFGAIGTHYKLTKKVAGKETSTSDTNTLYGTQETNAGGVYGGFRASVCLSESDDAAIYAGTELKMSRMMQKNTGYVTHSKLDSATSATTYGNHMALPAKSHAHSTAKEIFLAYSSIPGDDDTSYYTFKVAIGSRTHGGKDLLEKSSSGKEADIHETIGSLTFIYTI